jgi:AraC-like DNA-binding protein/quercetin dioxygenase-like cupin family protein
MKPLLKIVNAEKNKTFQIMNVNEPYFFPSWHFHPEYEVMLVLEGTGIRFVGDSMERFQAGDLVFYGANIPHLYRSDKEYYQKDSKLISKATVVYFKENFLGEHFWSLPDIAPIKKLLAHSRRGIRFKGKARNELKKHIQKLDDHKDGIDKIIDLLTILKIMAGTREYDLLSSSAFTKYVEEDDCERMNKVYQFLMDHYMESPSLEEVSQIANMSTTAFCRYFKSHTNKTYTQFLNEIKIGNACKLLIDNTLSISQICFETGFNNFTHFNSQFKKITSLTPSQYQDRHCQPGTLKL